MFDINESQNCNISVVSPIPKSGLGIPSFGDKKTRLAPGFRESPIEPYYKNAFSGKLQATYKRRITLYKRKRPETFWPLAAQAAI